MTDLTKCRAKGLDGLINSGATGSKANRLPCASRMNAAAYDTLVLASGPNCGQLNYRLGIQLVLRTNCNLKIKQFSD